MDVQKLPAPSAASVSFTPRPAVRPAEGGESAADAVQNRLAQLEQSLSNAFPPQLKLQLDVDKATHTVVGRVVDRQTGEMVRQIPSKEMVALLARSAEVNALLNKKV
jgi:flagellar protein FlaG